MKRTLTKLKNRIAISAAAAAAVQAVFLSRVGAVVADTPTSEIFRPINNMLQLFLDACVAIGALVLVIGIVWFVVTFVSHDTSQRINSIWTMAVGAIFLGIRVVLHFVVMG